MGLEQVLEAWVAVAESEVERRDKETPSQALEPGAEPGQGGGGDQELFVLEAQRVEPRTWSRRTRPASWRPRRTEKWHTGPRLRHCWPLSPVESTARIRAGTFRG